MPNLNPFVVTPVDSPTLEDQNLPTPSPVAPSLGIAPMEEPKTNPGPIAGELPPAAPSATAAT